MNAGVNSTSPLILWIPKSSGYCIETMLRLYKYRAIRRKKSWLVWCRHRADLSVRKLRTETRPDQGDKLRRSRAISSELNSCGISSKIVLNKVFSVEKGETVARITKLFNLWVVDKLGMLRALSILHTLRGAHYCTVLYSTRTHHAGFHDDIRAAFHLR